MKQFTNTAAQLAAKLNNATKSSDNDLNGYELDPVLSQEAWLGSNGYAQKSFATIEDEAEAIAAQVEYSNYLAEWIRQADQVSKATTKAEIKKAYEERMKAVEVNMTGLVSALDNISQRLVNTSTKGDKADQMTGKQVHEGIQKVMVSGDAFYVPKWHSSLFSADHKRRQAQANKAAIETDHVIDTEYGVLESQIGRVAHKVGSVYEALRKVNIPAGDGGRYKYLDTKESTLVRGAKTIAEGGTYTESVIEWEMKIETLKKIGDIIPYSEEFAYDYNFLMQEVEFFLNTNVYLKKADQIVNGDGLTSNVNGILNRISAYTPVAKAIADANIYDLIVVLREAVEANKRSLFKVDMAAMNIADINKYKLTKDDSGNYVMPPFVSADGQMIDGITVVEDNNITANSMFIGNSSLAYIVQAPGLGFERGYKSGGWEIDQPSLKIFERLQLIIRNNHLGAFLKVTDIATAVTTIATTP